MVKPQIIIEKQLSNERSFSDVGLSLNIDGSEDSRMKFQGQSPGKPADFTFKNTQDEMSHCLLIYFSTCDQNSAAIAKCRYS